MVHRIRINKKCEDHGESKEKLQKYANSTTCVEMRCQTGNH